MAFGGWWDGVGNKGQGAQKTMAHLFKRLKGEIPHPTDISSQPLNQHFATGRVPRPDIS